MPNALAAESSPYLRQHRDNPVRWLPWGEHALARARAEDRPLFLSIGYSSCHWCHVMEHESFEDPRTAALMNREFVCVKVDREERPDIDALYMEAVQAMTGHGGWPLSVFLTPEGVPFYGGTYFPPAARSGMPAFTEVLQAIAEAWREHAAEIRARGAEMTAQLRGAAALEPGGEQPGDAALDGAVERLAESFDHQHGGFGGAPKFPQAPVLELLLARAAHSDDEHGARAREMALGSLEAMAAGGIHDQIGGGFHRYAVDAAWRVPHFEKMLYDNALLARAYVHAHALGGGAGMAAVARDTLDWALREMLAPDGGFYSALDADSGGREGAYYVWSCEEVQAALGADAPAAIEWLGLGERGNFSDPHNPVPGLNVPRDALADSAPAEADVSVRARIRARLLATRELRERPGLDDKRLTAWNALMVTALAEAGDALGEPRYTEAARRCADFLLDRLRDDRGRLLRTNSGGA
ncbi:MAG: thioredoxin domain-containing protein, partial [Acidobacteriota bacterium]|nr:thioredoxin domain-containing protein [Acidobacteriota bacterium]